MNVMKRTCTAVFAALFVLLAAIPAAFADAVTEGVRKAAAASGADPGGVRCEVTETDAGRGAAVKRA